MDELKKIADKISAQNRTPLEDFDDFTPEEMHYMIYYPYSEQCPVKLRDDIDLNILKQSPIFNIVLDLLHYINQQDGLKLTPKGNLQQNVMRELYDKKYLPEEIIESGIANIRTEQDWMTLHIVKIVLKFSGIIRQTKGKLHLVKKWKKKFESNEYCDIYIQFFKYFTTAFNWAYNDSYENEETGQTGFLFLLYLFSKYGQDFRYIHFYTEKYFKAFPMLTIEDKTFIDNNRYNYGETAIDIRFFERFAERFGLVEIRINKAKSYFQREIEIKQTSFFVESLHFSRMAINT
jgi:hypothetical protein